MRSMNWSEHELPRPGPAMLFPMAWSLLPLVIGVLWGLLKVHGILSSSLMALGLLLSMTSVAIGTQISPGRLDFIQIIPSPFVAIILLMQPPYLLAVVLSVICWIFDYRHAKQLSMGPFTVYRVEWSPQDALPSIPSAKYARRTWAASPLFSVGEVKVKGVRINGMTYLESTGIINLSESE